MAMGKQDILNEVLEEEQTPSDVAESLAPAEELEAVEDLHASEEEEMAYDGEDELFPGGPTYNQISEWKSMYDEEVYASDFNGQTFIWRPVRRKEYKAIYKIEGAVDEHYMEEAICSKCILWPENYASHKMVFGKAGIPSTLSQLILERSGFLRPATMKL